MRRSRRNALALGKKEDGSPEPEAQSAVEEVFGVVPSADSVVLDNVESGSERSLAHLTNEQITAFREVFDLFDSNGGGTIDAEELDLALKSVDIQLSPDDLAEVLVTMDKDGNGEIDFQEFLNLMTNTERFLEGFATGQEKRKRENLLFDALTQFMKRSALHSINEIVGFYHTKYKRIQAPHVVGHYAAGARLIGLTENQLRKHMESLKARHAADDNKSPYAEPLHIVFGKVLRKKRPKSQVRPVGPDNPEMSHTRGKIRLNFGRLSLQRTSSNPDLSGNTPAMQDRHSITPAGQLLMSRQDQGKRKSPRPPLKKNGWVSQRFKPLVVELPSVDVKQEKKRNKPKQNINLTFDDLPKIREKASIKKPVAQAREVHFKRLRETKSKDSEEHWKSLGPSHIDSDVLRNYFRLAFNSYTPYVTIKLA
ncbi:unnamed protein product [Porites lobata]|uniref:EF-hand domain-containing protein n=1 Tax=Porites lobata TaxID=104759 RepID=A0ABN8R7J2_9CNID|nr:unnamed protein product [Porites lobata]